jgi:hypothetical protein
MLKHKLNLCRNFVTVQKCVVNLQCWNCYISQTVHCLKIPLQTTGSKPKCARMNERNWPAMNCKTQGPCMVGTFLFATSRLVMGRKPLPNSHHVRPGMHIMWALNGHCALPSDHRTVKTKLITEHLLIAPHVVKELWKWPQIISWNGTGHKKYNEVLRKHETYYWIFTPCFLRGSYTNYVTIATL